MFNAAAHRAVKNFTIDPRAFRKIPFAAFLFAFAFFLLMPPRVEAASKFTGSSRTFDANNGRLHHLKISGFSFWSLSDWLASSSASLPSASTFSLLAFALAMKLF